MPQIIKHPYLNYQAWRALRIATVFTFTITLERYMKIPHAGWTAFAVIMIYAGFDNGTTLFRAFHRFWGVLLGLLSGYLLWLIGHLDYRSLFLLIPFTIFLAYYLLGKEHSIPVVFNVNTAVIGNAYFFAHNNYAMTFFIFDYGMCTIIGFAIVILFEYFWFRHYRLLEHFIYDTQQEMINHLTALFELLKVPTSSQVSWFRSCLKFNNSLTNTNRLVNNSRFLLDSRNVVGDEFDNFVALSNQIFCELKALHALSQNEKILTSNYHQLLQQSHKNFTQLKQITNFSASKDIHEITNHTQSDSKY